MARPCPEHLLDLTQPFVRKPEGSAQPIPAAARRTWDHRAVHRTAASHAEEGIGTAGERGMLDLKPRWQDLLGNPSQNHRSCTTCCRVRVGSTNLLEPSEEDGLGVRVDEAGNVVDLPGKTVEFAEPVQCTLRMRRVARTGNAKSRVSIMFKMNPSADNALNDLHLART